MEFILIAILTATVEVAKGLSVSLIVQVILDALKGKSK